MSKGRSALKKNIYIYTPVIIDFLSYRLTDNILIGKQTTTNTFGEKFWEKYGYTYCR